MEPSDEAVNDPYLIECRSCRELQPFYRYRLNVIEDDLWVECPRCGFREPWE